MSGAFVAGASVAAPSFLPSPPITMMSWGKGCVSTFMQIMQFKTKIFFISTDFSTMCREIYNLSRQLSVYPYIRKIDYN